MFKRIYRQVFDLHNAALSKITTAPVEPFWDWFWEQARAITEEHDGDKFTVDMIVSVAEDVERRQLTQIHAGKIA